MDPNQISPQLIAALLAGKTPQQPGPLLAQPMGRDPVATMNGMMGGAGGIGGGGGGMLGGLDPMKLAQMQALLNRQPPPGVSVPGGAGMAVPGSDQFTGLGGRY